MNCQCPNLCRIIDTTGMEGRQPKDGLRMHPALGCPNTATVTIQVKCPTEGCVDEPREICEKCWAQYRRWISAWEFVECIRCKRFFDLRDYWVLPKRLAA